MQQTFWWSSWLSFLCYFHINLLLYTFTVVVTNTTVWTVITGRLVTYHTMSAFSLYKDFCKKLTAISKTTSNFEVNIFTTHWRTYSVVSMHESWVRRCCSCFYSSHAMFLMQWKRSIWDQCKKYEYWWPTTDQRVTDDQRPISGTIHIFWKISNGHNFAMRHRIYFMFGYRVGFSRTADQTALSLVR